MREITYLDTELHNEQMINAHRAGECMLVSMLKPEFGTDGNMFYFLYGTDLQSGVAGFGESPQKAMEDFNKSFHTDKKLIK